MARRVFCCCQTCSIEVDGDPVLNVVCHCDNCRRRTGTAFGWSIYFRDDQVVHRDGVFNEYAIDGVRTQTRYFCGACGTTLFWKISTRHGEIGIAGGCFGRADAFLPSATYSDSSRSDWVGLPHDWRVSI